MHDDKAFLEHLCKAFNERIPFNRYLGMQVRMESPDAASIRIDMRDEFVGNYHHGILHGGVISSTLDVMGGLTAFLSAAFKIEDMSMEERLAHFARLSTIDLRVDYLRPGRGEYFIATGTTLRTGNRIAVTRMQIVNDEKVLIAVGTGTYTVS